MNNKKLKKVLSVFLSVLMLMSCWVWVAPTDAKAADGEYNVKVYVNIYDGSDGYAGAYTVEESTGKPKNYSWATNDGWYGRINMTGFTVFGEAGDYDAQDVSAALVEAEKLNTYYDMSGLSNNNKDGDWDSKAIAKVEYTFKLNSFPVEVFWMNDENNWDGGNTGFAIRKLTVTTDDGVEHTMWEGLAGSDSETYNYYGSITPTGIHTCFEDYAKNYNMNNYKFYKSITTSSQRQWVDPHKSGSANTYYLNDYQSGGVSATFSEGVASVASNVYYIDTSSSNTYYINFTNHSKTQNATIVALNNGNRVEGYADNSIVIKPGETVSKKINISGLGNDEGLSSFSFRYTLDNVYESDELDAKLAEFYQPCYIGTWYESDDSKNADTFQLKNFGDFKITFQTDEGILESIPNTLEGNGTDSVKFKYRFYIDTSEIDDWKETGLRFHMTDTNYRRINFQNASYSPGTLKLGGNIDNSDSATLRMADFIYGTYNKNAEFVYNVTATGVYGLSVTPTWPDSTNSDAYATLYSYNFGSAENAWCRFSGKIFKGYSQYADADNDFGTIEFNNMKFRDTGNSTATFSGTINVYAFDKSELFSYVRDTLLDFAPMGGTEDEHSSRYNKTIFAAYETALANAMLVLANQKTSQYEVNTALANLKSAVAALQTNENLINQIDSFKHIQYVGGIGSEIAAETDARYALIPLGEHTVPANTAFIGNGTYKNATNKNSNLKTNYTKEDTAIDILNYYYWNIEFAKNNEGESVVDTTIEAVETALADFDDSKYSADFKKALEDAKADLEALDQEDGTDSPALQSEVDNAIATAESLIAHFGVNMEDHQLIKEEKGGYKIFFDDATHWYECEVCGYKYMHNEHTTTAIPDSKDKNSHIVECAYVDEDKNTCDFVMTEAHTYANPELARPTCVDGKWEDGTYTYTCECGAIKTETAVRANYSELEKAVEALKELQGNENLTQDEKDEIAAALEKANKLDDDLVIAEQDEIDALVKELQDVKKNVDNAISETVGSNPVTEADSGIKVKFLAKTGIDPVEYVQLGKDGGFETVRMRLANGNKDLPIKITSVTADNAYIGADTSANSSAYKTPITLGANGGSEDLYIVAPTTFKTPGIITYTITYTIDGLKDEDGNAVIATTKAYLYVKEKAVTPYHFMDEDCANGSATSEWNYYLDSIYYGDFAIIYNNKAPKTEFGNSNLEQAKSGYSHSKYDFEDSKCYAGCTDSTWKKGDAHAATYRYYIDTSLAKTYEEAGLRARIVESKTSYYENAPFIYVRLANNEQYLNKIPADIEKTFSTTLVPSSTSNVPTKRWKAISSGDMTVSQLTNSNEDEWIFGKHAKNDTNVVTAYANFSGAIPQNSYETVGKAGTNEDTEAKLMFSWRMEYNIPGFINQAESTTMTTHLYITSYDKAELRSAVANAETAGYNSAYFDGEKYEAYETALATAKEVLGKAETNQAEIDAAKDNLNAAIADLTGAEAKFVLTVTHSIHETDKESIVVDSTNKDYYLVNGYITPALNAEIIARDTINKYDALANLNVTADAEHTYNYWYIDYSGVRGAINAADDIIKDTTTGYTDEYKAEVKAARDALQELLGAENTNKNEPESQDVINEKINVILGHTHKYDNAIATEKYIAESATCKVKAKYYYSCACGAKGNETFESGEFEAHTAEVVVGKAATCTETGLTEGSKCSVCGETLVAQTVTDALGHKFSATVIANEATCLAAGNEAYKQCTVCNLYFAADAQANSTEGKSDSTSFVIKQLDHLYTGAIKSDGNGKDATHSYKCVNGCDTYGAATKHTWNDGKVTSAAGCINGGTKTYTCTAEGCGATYTETISANGHKFSATVTANEATCLAAGNEAYKQCTVCNLYFAADAQANSTEGKSDSTSFVIKQLDHLYTGDYVWYSDIEPKAHAQLCVNGCGKANPETTACTFDTTTEEPTCTDSGKTIYTCSVCQNSYYTTIASKGHTWNKDTEAFVADTSVENKVGYYSYNCSEDGCDGQLKIYVEAADYSELNSLVEALEKIIEDNPNLTDDAKKEIQNAIDKAKNLPKDLTKAATAEGVTTPDGQKRIDDLVAELKDVKVKAEKDIEDKTALKPDSSAAEDSVNKAEALEGKIELPEDVKTKIDELRTELNGILGEISEDDDATAKEYQERLDNVESAAKEILNKYAKCEAEGHKYGEAVITYPVYDESNDKWSKGTYTYTCTVCNYAKVETYERANYQGYDKALADLNVLLKSDITEDAKTEIRKVISDNAVANNLMTPDQEVIDNATSNLVATFEEYKGSLKTYTVTFVIDGSEDVVVTVISGQDVEAPTGVKKAYDETYHYNFTGWDDEVFTNITADKVVTAQFTPVAHSYDTHTDKDDTYHTDKCDCGYSKDVKHTETSKVTTKASCYADGVRTYTCSVCKGTRTETIAKREHNIINTTAALEPTCSATGIMNQKCDCEETAEYEACNYTTTRVIEIDKNAHDYDTTKSEANLTRPTKNDDGTWTKGYYTYTCKNNSGHTTTEEVVRATYTAYDEAVAGLNELLKKDTLTQSAKDEITSVLEANEIADNLIKDEQAIVDKAAEALRVVLDKIKNNTTGAYEKVDYKGYEASHKKYEDLVKQYGDKIKGGVEEDVADLDKTVDGVKNDPTANKAKDQTTVDNAKIELNKIIAGIKDGSLRNPDYKDVEDKLVEVNKVEGLNKDTQDKIDAIEKELQAIKDKKEPEANAKDDQAKVDALEERLDEILKDIANNTAKGPDFTNWNTAEGEYNDLDKTNVKDEILTEVETLKNTINTLKADPTANKANHQTTVDNAAERLNEIIAGIKDGSLLKEPDDGSCKHIGTEKEYITNVTDDNANNRHTLKCLACGQSIETEDCEYYTVTITATCCSAGYKVHSCAVCEYAFKTDYVSSDEVPHSYGNWYYNGASCKKAVTKTRYCSTPGCYAEETVVEVDENGKAVFGPHSLVIVNGQAATCLKDGYTDYTFCTVCNEVSESTVIPAKGHNDSNKDGNCDTCRALMNPSGHCSCLCHDDDSFFGRLLFKFVNFFWKLFKMNEYCECSARKHW